MIEPRNVLVLGLNYRPEPTGIAPYTAGMARFLADAGHHVHVVTGYPHYPYWRVAPGYDGLRMHEADGPVQVTRVRHPVPQNPTGPSRIASEMAFAAHAWSVRGPKPDAVIAVSPALMTVAAALRRSGHAPVGVVVQDLYGRAIAETGALGGGRGARAAAGLERALLSRADGVVAIHDTFRESMVGMGLERSRITVIRNWTHVRAATDDRATTRLALGWRPDETIALHAGNLGAKQGLENVVEAARMAGDRGLPIRFVLLGSGNQRARLEQLAAGIEQIQFLDPLADGEFENALAAADVLVLNERPQVTEMCVPSKLTSYFAAGRPVIAATSAGSAAATETAAAGAGRVVAPGEPEELLEGVRALVVDETAAAEMGASGLRYAESVLAESAARVAYVDWVQRLMAGVSRGGRPFDRSEAPREDPLASAR